MSTSAEHPERPHTQNGPGIDPTTVHVTLEVQDVLQTASGAYASQPTETEEE